MVSWCYSNTLTMQVSIFSTYTAMIPGPVHNLKLTLDRNKPSLTLDWEPPTNVDLGNPAELTQYEVSFKAEEQEGYSIQKIVPSSSTMLTLTSESGLILDCICQFSVRAKNRDDQTGKWNSASKLIGMYDTLMLIQFLTIFRKCRSMHL